MHAIHLPNSPITPSSTCLTFSCYTSPDPRKLHSFPTRRSSDLSKVPLWLRIRMKGSAGHAASPPDDGGAVGKLVRSLDGRSEEHTSELQSRGHLVCRLLLEKKKIGSSAFRERESDILDSIRISY